MAHDPASPILSFYDGGTDHRGRTRQGILAESDAWLEATHDYVQWVFPLPERSAYNADAPLLTQADIEAFGARPELRERLLDAARRLLGFYGFTMTPDQQAGDRQAHPGADSPARCTVLPRRTLHWITPRNHNFLRISRILRCLHLLGCPRTAYAFLAALEAVAQGGAGDIIGAETLAYWRSAASGKRPG